MGNPFDKFDQPAAGGNPFDKFDSGSAASSQPSSIAALGAGLGRGFGSTLLTAQQYLGKAVNGVAPDKSTVAKIGQWLVDDAVSGKAKLAAELAPYEQAHPIAAGIGDVGGGIAATWPVGGALANGVRGAAALPQAAKAAPQLSRLASAIETSGLRTGAPLAADATLAARLGDLGIRSAGGAITGGASAALATPDHVERGALIGAALPPGLIGVSKAAGYTGKAIKSFVEPFTEAGRASIVGRTLARFADDPEAIAAASGGPSITGALPTLAETTADSGIARLQDALRSVDPQLENLIGGRLAANNAARVSTLQNIAKSPADRDAAVAAVEAQAKQLYGQAFEESVPVTSALQRLVGKPSVQKAEARAIQLAREQGMPFQARLDDMRPRSIYAGMRDLPESGFVVPDNPGPIYAGTRRLPDSMVDDVSQQFSPLTLNPQPVLSSRRIPGDSVEMFVDLPPGLKDISVPSGRAPTFVDIPPVDSVPVRDMHTLKMGMDALLSDPTLGIAGREAAAVMATRNKLLDLLPESYQVARQGHIQMNKPVNQMDIGSRLLQTYSSATKDLSNNPTLRAEAFNRALQDEAKLIKQSTGVKGIKRLTDVMEPDQISAIQAIADELSRTAAVAKVGNGPGAASAQRLASQNILQQTLPRSWAGSDLVQTAAKPLNVIYGGITDPKIQKLLADAILDPNLAATLAKKQFTSGPSALERLLALPTVAQPLVRAVPVASDR